MQVHHTDYRTLLKQKYSEKRKRNPAYSMHAFAKLLGVSQAAVSQVFSGKKNFSYETAVRVASKLELDEEESERFILLLQLEKAKNESTIARLSQRLELSREEAERAELDLEIFVAISEWYHLVIRNAAETDAPLTVTAISRRLGISEADAKTALERLCRLGLLEADIRSPSGYRRIGGSLFARSSRAHEGLRKFHRQLLEKAIESLTGQTPQEKIVGSETLAFSARQMKEAEKLTREYFKKMSALADAPGPKESVYHLATQFFRVY